MQILHLRVLIASPGDVPKAREATAQAIRSWNSDLSSEFRVHFDAVDWNTDAVPIAGQGGPQDQINQQLGDAEIVIALFHSRLGTATGRSPSGTAEEINNAVAAAKPVHIYFDNGPHPSDVDIEQLGLLRKFRESLTDSFVAEFSSLDDLRKRIRKALTQDAKNHRPTDVSATHRLDELVSRFTHVRATTQAGHRTMAQETVVQDMVLAAGAIDPEQVDLPGYLASPDPGRRLAAYAVLYRHADTAAHFAERLARSVYDDESRAGTGIPFCQYHALRALRKMVSAQPDAISPRALEPLQGMLDELGPKSDRAGEIRRILRKVAEAR